MAVQPLVTIYHNPRCTKSCQALRLLRERGAQPIIVEYLKQPPDEKTLARLIKLLGIRAIDLVRKKENLFRELGLEKKQTDHIVLIKTMVKHPILIERPIAVKGRKAALGRPPENVLRIL